MSEKYENHVSDPLLNCASPISNPGLICKCKCFFLLFKFSHYEAYKKFACVICKIHLISAQTSQDEIICTKDKEYTVKLRVLTRLV